MQRAHFYDGDDRDERGHRYGYRGVGWYFIDQLGAAIGPYESEVEAEFWLSGSIEMRKVQRPIGEMMMHAVEETFLVCAGLVKIGAGSDLVRIASNRTLTKEAVSLVYMRMLRELTTTSRSDLRDLLEQLRNTARGRRA